MNKYISVSTLLLIFVVGVQSQLSVATYYPGSANCAGASHRVEYRHNSSCIEEGCVNVGLSSRYYSCRTSIPVTYDTVTITSFSNSECTGDFVGVGVYPQDRCIVGTTTYSKINCNGTYTCSDPLCKDCNITSLPTSCKASKSGGSIYVCNSSPSSSTSPSSSSSDSLSLSLFSKWLCVLAIIVVFVF